MPDPPHGDAPTFDRILIRMPNWLGDALMARPLVHALRAACSQSEIRGIAPAGLVPLLAADRVFDRIHVWPGRESGDAVDELRRELRAWRPQAGLVLPPSFSSAWFMRSTGARQRLGYAHEWRSWTLSRALPRRARGDLHLSAEYLALGAALLGGRLSAVSPPDLPVPEGGDEAQRALGLHGGRIVVLGPGAVYGPAKRWPVERFVAVGRRLRDEGLHVVVCGAAGDVETCATVAAGIGEGATDLAGRTSLPALTSICARATASVCNDSGLAHVSAATGTPTIVVFGSTSSAWTAPLGRRVRVVQSAPVCSPCFQRTCRIGYACLERVSVAQVRDAVIGVAA